MIIRFFILILLKSVHFYLQILENVHELDFRLITLRVYITISFCVQYEISSALTFHNK